MRPTVVALVLAWTHAGAADDSMMRATIGPRIALTAGDNPLGRFAVSIARRFADRFEVGAGTELEVGVGGMYIAEEVAEAGLWMHASSKIALLVGTRIGYAYFHFGFTSVNAAVFDPVLEISYRLSPTAEIRFAPLATSVYLSGLVQVTAGPEVGLAWRL